MKTSCGLLANAPGWNSSGWDSAPYRTAGSGFLFQVLRSPTLVQTQQHLSLSLLLMFVVVSLPGGIAPYEE